MVRRAEINRVFMHIVALNSVLILVNIILDLAVLGTMAVLVNRHARRLRVVQRQLVDMIRAMPQAEYEQVRDSDLEAVLAALKTQRGIVQ